MQVSEYITIRAGGRIYRIKKAPFETTCKTFERGWSIVKETKDIPTEQMTPDIVNSCLNQSYETFFKKNGVEYNF